MDGLDGTDRAHRIYGFNGVYRINGLDGKPWRQRFHWADGMDGLDGMDRIHRTDWVHRTNRVDGSSSDRSYRS